MKTLKLIVHIVSASSAALAALNSAGLVPAQYASYTTAAAVLVSGVLHFITRKYPELLLP